MAKPTAVTDLGSFDGKDVITTSIAITNAGDGLSTALSIEPQTFHHRQVVTVVLECEVTQIKFLEVKDTDRLARVHTLRAGIATVVDPDLVAEVLTAQRLKIEQARGVQQLPLTDAPDSE